ncbi:MAG: hypothetical protein ACLQVD_22085 [Capsulimonadaceae bacterium]
MLTVHIITVVTSVIALLFAPRHFRRSRVRGAAYLVGLILMTTVLLVLINHISGFYQNALGPDQ